MFFFTGLLWEIRHVSGSRPARELISHQEGHGRVFLGEALHFLQHAAEDRHHPSLVLALCLERPLAAVLLKTASRRRSLVSPEGVAPQSRLRTRQRRRKSVTFVNPLDGAHLAACGSSMSASTTWEMSKQLCCWLSGESRR